MHEKEMGSYMKRFLAISLCLFLTILPITAHAHSGRTDASGGHYDRTTGEYHYHHGYPAHDHYDMDGDGILDCPYDFNEKNNGIKENISESSGVKNTISTVRDSPEEKEKSEMRDILIVIALSFIIVFGQYLVIRQKNYDIAYWKNKLDLDLKKQKNEYEAKITASESLEEILAKIASGKREESEIRMHIAHEYEELEKVKQQRRRKEAEIQSLISHGYEELEKIKQKRKIMKQAPLDVSFGEDGMPIYWKPNPKKPYGDYTVYFNEKSGIYHVDHYCASYVSKETHIFKVIDRARPCKKCAEGFFNFVSVPDWYKSEQSS